jgi:hypothetical protein
MSNSVTHHISFIFALTIGCICSPTSVPPRVPPRPPRVCLPQASAELAPLAKSVLVELAADAQLTDKVFMALDSDRARRLAKLLATELLGLEVRCVRVCVCAVCGRHGLAGTSL